MFVVKEVSILIRTEIIHFTFWTCESVTLSINSRLRVSLKIFNFPSGKVEPKASDSILQIEINLSQEVRRLFYSQSPVEMSFNAVVCEVKIFFIGCSE